MYSKILNNPEIMLKLTLFFLVLLLSSCVTVSFPTESPGGNKWIVDKQAFQYGSEFYGAQQSNNQTYVNSSSQSSQCTLDGSPLQSREKASFTDLDNIYKYKSKK